MDSISICFVELIYFLGGTLTPLTVCVTEVSADCTVMPIANSAAVSRLARELGFSIRIFMGLDILLDAPGINPALLD
jgi:hypothetical protein